MKLKSYILQIAMAAAGAAFLGSCEDMLEPDSNYVLYDADHLKNPADTANSLVGIIYKLQAVGDRTNLLGEVRGDLVRLTSAAHADLRQLADFSVDDDNRYNNPRDYYAVINNCNYYIAYADSNAFDNRGNRIFDKEIAQVKAIRAWTYLQLALNYGKVPFYTEPLLTEQDANNVSLDVADRKDLEAICDYLIPDLLPYAEVDWPALHTVGSIFMANCFFPVKMVLGDLYLWKATLSGDRNYYREAARYYYSWILDNRSLGDLEHKSPFIVSSSIDVTWYSNNNNMAAVMSTLGSLYSMATDHYGNETFTIIPMDSASAQGYFSEVRNLYNSPVEDNIIDTSTPVSIMPSTHLQEISRAQSYYYLRLINDEEVSMPVVPDELLYEGDLRLAAVWSNRMFNTTVGGMSGSYEYSHISKLDQRNISVYRQTDVWLRLAEALNNGGLPRYAYAILATGLSEDVLNDSILAYCSREDSSFVNSLDPEGYIVANYFSRNGLDATSTNQINTIGIHSRGCGYAERNPDYAYPMVDSMDVDGNPINDYTGQSRQQWAQHNLTAEQAAVDSMIINEMALETCFEGKRFYDLMRFAKRYHDTEWVAGPVSRRNGEDNQDLSLYSRLKDENNWYMSWNHQIGPR